MFRSSTGWWGLALAIFGALTSAQMLPIVTGVVTSVVGTHAAETVGIVLAAIGTLIAKLSAANHADGVAAQAAKTSQPTEPS